MRGFLAGRLHRAPAGQDLPAELRSYRICGIVLLVMNQALAGIVFYIVKQNRGFTYSGTLIYAMAAYTFYITISAAVNVARFRKLETAMLAQFGAETPRFRLVMTAASGGAVCVFVLGMAVYMIVRSTRRLKSLRPDRPKQ